jgi:gluconate 2-dehydrogenase subunit 3-like protein
VRTRRQFLFDSLTGVSAAWVAAYWPEALAAAQHAQAAAQAGAAPAFEFFTVEMAKEVEAIASRIIPSDETPGAREAGVVYFIDRALTTFAKEDQELYSEGIRELQARVRERFPGAEQFSALRGEQQDEILQALDRGPAVGVHPFGKKPATQGFFETLRQHTIAGFLIDPESDRKGNRDGVGWKLIGRESAHMFQPPFGHYDKDYAGWQAPRAASGGSRMSEGGVDAAETRAPVLLVRK